MDIEFVKRLCVVIGISILFVFPEVGITESVNLQIPLPKTSGGYQEKIDSCLETTTALGEKILKCEGIAIYVKLIFEWLARIAAILAVGMMVWGGTLWMMAGGNTGKVGEGKKIIGNALTGLVLMLCSVTLLYIINPKLVDLSALNLSLIKPVELKILQNALLSTPLPQTPGACCYKEKVSAAVAMSGVSYVKIGKKVGNAYECYLKVAEVNRSGTLHGEGFFCEGDTSSLGNDATLCWINGTPSDDTRSKFCQNVTPIPANIISNNFAEVYGAKYKSWGYPEPKGTVHLTGEGLLRWKALLPLAILAAQKTGTDIGTIGMWPWFEYKSQPFDPFIFDNCNDRENNPNTPCNNFSAGAWQVGYALHPGNMVDILPEAFHAMYEEDIRTKGFDHVVRDVGTSIIDKSKSSSKPLMYIDPFPTDKTLAQLIRGYHADSTNERWLVGQFMRDDKIGMYLVARHMGYWIQRPSGMENTLWGVKPDGSPRYAREDIIEYVRAIYEAGF